MGATVPPGWGAVVVCEPGICPLFEAIYEKARVDGRSSSARARVGRERNSQTPCGRPTAGISFHPGLSGFMELRSSNEISKKGSHAYDPFERRVRVSGSEAPV